MQIHIYAAGFSSDTFVAPETAEAASSAGGGGAHASVGNFCSNTALYFGWLQMGKVQYYPSEHEQYNLTVFWLLSLTKFCT